MQQDWVSVWKQQASLDPCSLLASGPSCHMPLTSKKSRKMQDIPLVTFCNVHFIIVIGTDAAVMKWSKNCSSRHKIAVDNSR